MVEDELDLPFDDGGIAWDPSLVFPGLRERRAPRERDRAGAAGADPRRRRHAAGRGPGRSTRTPARAARRSTSPAKSAAADEEDGSGSPATASRRTRRSGSAASSRPSTPGSPASRAARCWPSTKRGTSVRVIAQAEPQPGAPVKTTIDPDLQEAAVSALAGRAGGIAVLDARNGDVRALAGQAFSAPQPPGSTFKIITTTAALQNDVVSLDDEFEITNGVNVGGRFIDNANGEYCGGTFREAFAESCNAVFAPLGPEIGNDDLVATAERFGFNSPPTLYAPQIVREVDPPNRPSRPRSATKSTSASARSARAKSWRRRCRWRASRRRSPTAASASRPRSSPTGSCAPTQSRCG